MKKRIITCFISMILLISLIVLLINKNAKTFESDGITYAVMVDGNKETGFPSKGIYQVDADCINAKGKWDYDNWKLNLEEITGKISCDIKFTTIEKINLNDYVVGLSDTTQGRGSVVHETFGIPDFTNATTLTQAEYGTTSQYYSSYHTNATGTAVTDAFSFSDGMWTSNTSNIDVKNDYSIKFTLSGGSYYQLCYEMSTGHQQNGMHWYVGDFDITKGSSYYGVQPGASGCESLGYLTEDTDFRVALAPFTEIATMKFYVQKANDGKTVDTGYRYEGQNPNNYIWFNNELWRIIGVFDSNNHGVANKNLVKIIRNDSIGGLVWNTSGTTTINGWNTSTLKSLLNDEYLNSGDGTDTDKCYGCMDNYSRKSKTTCDYRAIGIKDNFQEMIKEVSWYFGGSSEDYITADLMYNAERDETKATDSNPIKVNSKIGLMNGSDYGYAALSDNCPRLIKLDRYDYCTLNNWLFKSKEWSISQKGTDYPLSIDDRGIYGGYEYRSYPQAVRPVLYLNENVYVLDGDGSANDPYIIGM